MIRLINKLLKTIRFFLQAKKVWRWPGKSTVLIYDAAHLEILLEFLSPWKPEILHLRNEQINLPVLWSCIVKGEFGRKAYVDHYISRVRPKLIVTYVHNTSDFYSISKRHPAVRTLFIQNGLQSYYLDVIEILDRQGSKKKDLRVDYMMTFGVCSGALYSRYMEGTAVSVGSVKNNNVPKLETTNIGSLVYISQFRISDGFVLNDRYFSKNRYFGETDKIVLHTLSRYAEEHGKEFSIIPNSKKDDTDTLEKEMHYFNEILGQTCNILKIDRHYTSYDATDSAEVVVAIESALGFESAARGNKTAIFSIRTELFGVKGLTFGWPENYPDDGPFWTNRPDPATFEKILDHLFEIDDEQWQAELSEHGYEKIISYDPGNTILKSVLQKELIADV